MILDDICNFDLYVNLNSKFNIVSEFLKNNDLNSLKQGSYEIDGKNIYFNVDEYKTKNVNDSKPEAHRKYIDIQIVINGNEKIGYSNISEAKTSVEYDSVRDIEFFDAKCEYMNACSGKFFIFYPQDVHHPCITNVKQSDIKKIVFKILI